MFFYIYIAIGLIISPFATRTVHVTHNRQNINFMIPNAGNINTTDRNYDTVFKNKQILTSGYENPQWRSSPIEDNTITATNFYNSAESNSHDKVNEFLYLLNKKTKVYIHIEQLIPHNDIYHIGITFKTRSSQVRYDMVGKSMDRYAPESKEVRFQLYSTTLLWEYTDKTLDEVLEFEKNMQHNYILGINDCRHYVRYMTTWACDKPTPIWTLDILVNKIRNAEI
jgi:hypothetical protein